MNKTILIVIFLIIVIIFCIAGYMYVNNSNKKVIENFYSGNGPNGRVYTVNLPLDTDDENVTSERSIQTVTIDEDLLTNRSVQYCELVNCNENQTPYNNTHFKLHSQDIRDSNVTQEGSDSIARFTILLQENESLFQYDENQPFVNQARENI